jgi:hypothetical protein
MDDAGSVDASIGETESQAGVPQAEQAWAAENMPSPAQQQAGSAGGGSSFMGILGDIFPVAKIGSAIGGLFGLGGSTPTAPTPFEMPPSMNFSGSLNTTTGQLSADTGIRQALTSFDHGITSTAPTSVQDALQIASTPPPGGSTSTPGVSVSMAGPSSGMPEIAGERLPSSAASGAGGSTIAVSVSAMNASDIAARGSDIADAIRTQLLQGHSIVDAINEITG